MSKESKMEKIRNRRGVSYRTIELDTGIPRSTAERIHKGLSQPKRCQARALFNYYDKKISLAEIYDPFFKVETDATPN